jgi:hypothetical protein
VRALAWIGCTAVCTLGCNVPPFVQVTVEGGVAERVIDANGPSMEGSFDLHIWSPNAAEPTEVLLLTLNGTYRYPDCSDRFERLTVSSDRPFPIHVQPGAEERVTVSFGSPDPVKQGCEVPTMLKLQGLYYDSMLDAYEDEDEVPLSTEIPLDIDPGLAGPSDYTCVGSVPSPIYGTGNSKAIVWLRDYGTGDVIPGVEVKVCAIGDAPCTDPVDEGTTDIVGIWPLDVPKWSPYFYDVAAPTGFVPTLFFEYLPPAPPGFERILTPMGATEVDSILGAMGVSPAAMTGFVAVRAFDCKNTLAVGLTFAVELGNPTVGYWKAGTFSSNEDATTEDGFALMANVPAGTATVTAVRAATGEEIASRVVHVREGAVSFVDVDPTPTN